MRNTLQEQYNLIKEGKGNKQQFFKSARQLFPNLITPINTYEDTVRILKNKSIIAEGIGGVVTKGKTPDWHSIFNENMIKEYGEDSGGQDMTWGMYNRSTSKKDQGNQDIINKGKEDYNDGIPFEACPYESGYNKYYKVDLAKLWQMGWKEAKAEDQLPPMADKDLPMGLTEAKEAKAEEKETTKEVTDMATRGYDYKDEKNYDNVFGQEFLKGYYTEMKDPKNEGKHVEELRQIVAKNLAKDINHYVKDGQFGVKGVGYTVDAPGLGEPKPAKGKHKSSGYGDLKESVLRSQIYLLAKEVLAEELESGSKEWAMDLKKKADKGDKEAKAKYDEWKKAMVANKKFKKGIESGDVE